MTPGYEIDFDSLGLTMEQFEYIKRSFAKYDSVGNGFISTSDVSRVAAELGESFEQGEILEAQASLDSKKHGSVSFRHFIIWWI